MTRDPAVTSRIMRTIRNHNTKPELTLRRELHRRGLRYRVQTRVLGRPDLVFPTPKVAVFVDGDYWHGNTWRIRGAESLESYFVARANSSFWLEKIRANIARDKHVTHRLRSEGWDVIRVWESDLAADPLACANHVERRVRMRTALRAVSA
jgi:DNA mismatch endonuclease (patch repair protein)